MKKLIPFIIFSLFSINALAQNYRCVQPGVKRYFTNNNHYLRGVRVDSVKTVGTDTVLYLFRTPRGRYGTDSNMNPLQLDVNGGSWLGKTITIKPDGTHEIPNYWGDTVIIKSQAQLNESWIIYDDTTSHWYEAAVTEIDTMTVLGTIDTVKTITLTAKHLTTINTNDPLHNQKIRISKNYGLVTTCDFYMFPLHEPGIAYKQGFDFYTDNAGYFSFNLTEFHNPKMTELNNWQVGDLLERKFESVGTGAFGNIIEVDYISQKNIINGDKIIYTINRWRETTPSYFGPPPPPPVVTTPSIENLSFGANLLFDVLPTPEEVGNTFFYSYNPIDTQFCETSPFYSYRTNFVFYNYVHQGEMCGRSYSYKIGIGTIRTYECTGMGPPSYYLRQFIYLKRNGVPCGKHIPLNIIESEYKVICNIHPNPANEQITININSQQKYKLTIINAMGQVLKTIETDKQELTIPVADLPNGVYYLAIKNEAGIVSNEKVIVQH